MTLLEACLRGVSPPGPVLLVNLTGYVEEVGAAVTCPDQPSILVAVHFERVCGCDSEVLGLRLQGQMAGDGLQPFHYSKLYYLSLHSIDPDTTYPYANTRVLREISDAWLDKKFTYGGMGYDDADAGLTEEACPVPVSAQRLICYVLRVLC